jgi:putative endonuclease
VEIGESDELQDVLHDNYIVASRSHNFYVGMTSEIEVRVRQHQEGRFDGYSKQYNCNRLVWFERHPDAVVRSLVRSS